MGQSNLPYDPGNVGDLLKHGVLAEFVRWRCHLGKPVRFLDLFAGEPYEEEVSDIVVKRVQALAGSALWEAQPDISDHCYYGSGNLVRKLTEKVGGDVRVFVADCDPERLQKLRASGLSTLDEEFPSCGLNSGQYDAYTTFEQVVDKAEEADLVLIDDFSRFLPDRAPNVVPRIKEMAERASVLLFALNLDPHNSVGRQFDTLLEQHLRCAWRMTCPPLSDTGVNGESKYHADVILAAHPLLEHRNNRDVAELKTRLDDFAKKLAGVLGLSESATQMLMPGVIA